MRRNRVSGAQPVTAKPRLSRSLSLVCPPTSEHLSSAKAVSAPDSIWTRSSSARASSPTGRPARASAAAGSAPMAWRSAMAWTAAIRPNTKGSSRKAGNWSTVWTASWPGGGAAMAASSGASRPITMSSPAGTGSSRARARRSTGAATLAPQPPQRMDVFVAPGVSGMAGNAP